MKITMLVLAFFLVLGGACTQESGSSTTLTSTDVIEITLDTEEKEEDVIRRVSWCAKQGVQQRKNSVY